MKQRRIVREYLCQTLLESIVRVRGHLMAQASRTEGVRLQMSMIPTPRDCDRRCGAMSTSLGVELDVAGAQGIARGSTLGSGRLVIETRRRSGSGAMARCCGALM